MRILLLAFLLVLLVAACQDIRKMEIKDACHIAIAVLAVMAIFIEPQINILSKLGGALCVSMPMLVLTLIMPGAFGGGDIKLTAAAGLFLGWENTVVSAVIAVFSAGAYAVFLLVEKKADKRQYFPFGPFLCEGMAIGALWGEKLWQLWQSW